MKKLRGYNIRATDGYIGKAYEFYFDDKSWSIRYLVVDIGNWFSGRQVIIKPSVFNQPDWKNKELPVLLMKEEVANNPSIDSDKPISRQRADEMKKRIDRSIYGLYGEYGVGMPIMTEKQVEKESDDEALDQENKVDMHLRSTREIIGYGIQAIDGSIGRIDDFIVDDETWVIKYIVVNTREWLPGRKILILPDRVKNIKWSESKVYVDLPKKTIKESPGVDHSAPVNGKYEDMLCDYYGRRKYSA
jgi:uncharacterized protein YrrD